MSVLIDRARATKDGAYDWALALGLTAVGWAQLAVVPFFLDRVPPQRFSAGGRIPPPFVMTPHAEPTWVAFVLVALATLPLAWRRRAPVAVLVVSMLFTGVYDSLRQPPVMIVFAPLVALYTLGSIRPRKTLIVATAVSIAVTLLVSLPSQPSSRFFAEAIRLTAMFAFAGALGDATRNRRAYIAEVEQRAAEAERTREDETRRRVEEERLRIARELHDVTAHSLSIVAVQAGAAEKVLDRDPAAARRALQTIRATSRSSLDELRAMLGVLRGAEEDAPFAPQGSIERLAELAETLRAAGVEVDLDVGELGVLPAFAEVSVYRIVQEALTNVVRHAQATVARVSLTREDDELVLEIVDDGVGGTPDIPEGHGIAGMRERVAALGGRFVTGPGPNGGFRVHATVPLKGGAS